MKEIFKYLVVALLMPIYVFSQQSQPSKGFELTGQDLGLTNEKLFLVYINKDGKEIKDTISVVNNSFKTRGVVGSPVLSWIFSSDFKVNIHFWLENSKITLKKGKEDYAISGSQAQKDQVVYDQLAASLLKRISIIDLELRKEKKNNNQQRIEELTNQKSVLESEKVDLAKSFVKQYPNSFVSLEQLAWLTQKNLLPSKDLKTIFTSLGADVQNSNRGKQLSKGIEFKIESESIPLAKAFTLKDKDGIDVSLSNYKGKYLLIDFWASWCAPCREENPNVLKAYNEFHSKGLEILAISLDTKRADWLKAIEQDKLPWKHVSDLKGWKSDIVSLYRVGGIPDNFLVDPDGVIIGRHLRGTELHDKLAEVLK